MLWSKGPLRNSYSRKHTESTSTASEIKKLIQSAKPILFLRNGSFQQNDLELFADHLDLLTHPIQLVTMDGDRPMPSSQPLSVVQKVLECPMVLSWHTQNYDKSILHEKLKPIPIGFDLHTHPFDKMNYMIHCRKMAGKRKWRILSDSHHTISHPERLFLYQTLKNNKWIDFTKKVSIMEISKLYNQYYFALSPRGNGLDCHRTWELLLAGVIVITKTSPLDDMYKDLPVVILKDWSELNHGLEKKLNRWYQEHAHKTTIDNIKKLTFDYWLS
jgi:hypothetical protein